MLKWLGVLCIFASCTGVGFVFAERKKQHLSGLQQLRQFFLSLQGEIRYGGTPLKEAIEIAVQGKEKTCSAFLRIAEAMEGKNQGVFFSIWERELKQSEKEGLLERRDIQRLLRVGEMLGSMERKLQLDSLSIYLQELSGDIEAEQQGLAERLKLYRTLGVLGGTFVCILLL